MGEDPDVGGWSSRTTSADHQQEANDFPLHGFGGNLGRKSLFTSKKLSGNSMLFLCNTKLTTSSTSSQGSVGFFSCSFKSSRRAIARLLSNSTIPIVSRSLPSLVVNRCSTCAAS